MTKEERKEKEKQEKIDSLINSINETRDLQKRVDATLIIDNPQKPLDEFRLNNLLRFLAHQLADNMGVLHCSKN